MLGHLLGRGRASGSISPDRTEADDLALIDLETRIARHKIPSRMWFPVEALPRNATGK